MKGDSLSKITSQIRELEYVMQTASGTQNPLVKITVSRDMYNCLYYLHLNNDKSYIDNLSFSAFELHLRGFVITPEEK